MVDSDFPRSGPYEYFCPDALIQKPSLLFISEILKYARYGKFLSSSVLWLLPSDNQIIMIAQVSDGKRIHLRTFMKEVITQVF